MVSSLSMALLQSFTLRLYTMDISDVKSFSAALTLEECNWLDGKCEPSGGEPS